MTETPDPLEAAVMEAAQDYAVAAMSVGMEPKESNARKLAPAKERLRLTVRLALVKAQTREHTEPPVTCMYEHKDPNDCPRLTLLNKKITAIEALVPPRAPTAEDA